MANQYPYDSEQADPNATTVDDLQFPAPTRTYGNQPQHNPPAGPGRPNPIGDLTTIYKPVEPPAAPVQPQRSRRVAPPVGVPAVRSKPGGESAAVWSVLIGLASLLVSLVPVCGVVALLPAAMSIVFGMMGLRSRLRALAIVGMLLSLAAILLAVTLVA